MKKIILPATFLICIGVSAHATPLITKNGTSTLNIEGTTYTIVDRSDTTTPLDIWQNPYGYTATGSQDYTGLYLGTVTSTDGKAANDSTTDLNNLLGYFFDNTLYEISSYEKWEYKDDTDQFNLDEGIGELTVSTPDDGYSGTWSLTAPHLLDFYSIKSSTEYALYVVDPAMASGFWTTRHLLNKGSNIPAISHFSATLQTEPIPEPATMLLMGTGLAGLAGLRRKKKK